jgi:glycosyltransferase involved in cell wall biosynthesis
MSVPRVSVVMPICNAGRFLDLAISSIRAQTLTDFELILVDDGSTDDSDHVLCEHTAADPRLSVLRLPHGGIATALNHGIVRAQSNLIAIMNGDDEAMPERLERQVAAMQEYPDVAVLGTAADMMDQAGRTLGRIQPPTDPALIRDKLMAANWLAHPTVMMRRDVVLAAGGYRPIFTASEDYDLWLRLSEHHDLSNTPEPLLRYRVHDGQVSRRRWVLQRLEVVAAQHVAQLRRTGRPDPMQHHRRIDAATLRAIGVPRDVISAALAGQEANAPSPPSSHVPSLLHGIQNWWKSH